MKIRSFRDIVLLWESPDVLAREIGAPIAAVRKWPQPLRNTIPAEWWDRVAATPIARAHGVTLEMMARLAKTKAASRATRDQEHASTNNLT